MIKSVGIMFMFSILKYGIKDVKVIEILSHTGWSINKLTAPLVHHLTLSMCLLCCSKHSVSSRRYHALMTQSCVSSPGEWRAGPGSSRVRVQEGGVWSLAPGAEPTALWAAQHPGGRTGPQRNHDQTGRAAGEGCTFCLPFWNVHKLKCMYFGFYIMSDVYWIKYSRVDFTLLLQSPYSYL